MDGILILKEISMRTAHGDLIALISFMTSDGLISMPTIFCLDTLAI